jgi:hypothetical protein
LVKLRQRVENLIALLEEVTLPIRCHGSLGYGIILTRPPPGSSQAHYDPATLSSQR